jgi:hypothetical protein
MTLLGPVTVYSLCLVTSLLCAVLLTRAYLQSRANLQFWTALAFGLLALNNLFLVGDLLIFPGIDFWLYRQLAALGAIGVLLYGFLREVC